MNRDQLMQFYGGAASDSRGRSIESIWAFDDAALESVHDFIQWLFPTRKASAFNAEAPQLSDADVAEFRDSPELQARLRRSLEVMLRFYGLRRVSGTVGVVRIQPAADLATRGPRWWSAGNHNHLRLTRIMDSLAELGLEHESRALYQCLNRVRRDNPTGISERTIRYWAEAARIEA